MKGGTSAICPPFYFGSGWNLLEDLESSYRQMSEARARHNLQIPTSAIDFGFLHLCGSNVAFPNTKRGMKKAGGEGRRGKTEGKGDGLILPIIAGVDAQCANK